MENETALEVTAMRLADGSMAVFDTQRVGRMGELVVELELLKRGWIVGNFNHTHGKPPPQSARHPGAGQPQQKSRQSRRVALPPRSMPSSV